MTPERWKQIEKLYHAALQIEPGQRTAFLKEGCTGDEDLRGEVESLLVHKDQAEGFIEVPALEAAVKGLAEDQTQTLVGRQIGAYKITSLLGAGGMGEVYRAQDTRLGRKVALKLLSARFTEDPDRLRRFEREARAASALNHPNILTIYEIGKADGAIFIATEFIDGQTLREQIRQGKMKLRDKLEVCLQAAGALAVAHEAGIVHRDIKPENLMLRRDGIVKVLDFGLAKLIELPKASLDSDTATQANWPTATGTLAGTVMGTVPYMSPEQAEGRPVDHRSDIFSLGVVLYELLTSQQPFTGKSTVDVLHAIVHQEPRPATELNPQLPDEVGEILGKALAKDLGQRYRHAGDFELDLRRLKHAVESGTRERTQVRKTATPRTRRVRLVPVLGGLGAAVLAAALWYGISNLEREADKPRETLAHAASTQLTNQPGEEYYPSLSPDGRSVVYASRAAGNWDIYLLRIGGQNPINLTKDSAADDTQAVFSPDGDFIAFRSERDRGGIFVMGATGESVKRLTDFGHNPAWSPDGSQIVFASHGFDIPSARGLLSQLWTVTVATGNIRQVTKVRDAVQPSWSPHGDRIAFWSFSVSGQRDIWTISSAEGEAIPVTSDNALDWNPVWSPDGKFLYFSSDRGGSMNLWRVPIEERSGRVLREPEPVTTGGGAVSRQNLSISRDGRRLVFVERIGKSNLQKVAFDPTRKRSVGQPVWITQGSRQANTLEPSPDGEWVAFSSMGAPQEDLFLIRSDGTGERQITNDPPRDRFPRWSPDGKRIAFYSNRLVGRFQIWAINPDGSGLQRLGETDQANIIPSWSPDNLRMAYYTGGQFENFISELDKPWKDHSERLPHFSEADVFGVNSWSPDGKWLAGHVLSKKSSTNNPNGTAMYSLESKRFQKLTDFGWAPVWLSDSRRLLFPYQDKIYLVDSRSKKFHEIFSTGSYTIFPYSLSVSSDNQWLYFALEMNEADIWLMTLQ